MPHPTSSSTPTPTTGHSARSTTAQLSLTGPPRHSTRTRQTTATIGAARARHRTRPQPTRPSVPTSVWPAATRTAPDCIWPTHLLRAVITAFTTPGDQVELFTWPHASSGEPSPRESDAAHALAAVADLGRPARLLPFEKDPRTGRAHNDPTGDLSQHHPAKDDPGQERPAPGPAALVVAAVHPHAPRDQAQTDAVLYALAERLQARGVLAVLTYPDWSHGQLIDPAGALIESAQNAGLFYLQHLIALHEPLPATDPHPSPGDHAPIQRPGAHRRIHSDVLVLTTITNTHTVTRAAVEPLATAAPAPYPLVPRSAGPGR